PWWPPAPRRPPSPCPPRAAARRPPRTPPGRGPRRAARAPGPRRGGRPRPRPRPGGAGAGAPGRARHGRRPRPTWLGGGRRLARAHPGLEALADHVRDLEGAEPVPAAHRRRLARAHRAQEGIDLGLQRVALGDLAVLQGERRLAVAVGLAAADEHTPLAVVDRQVS